MENLDWLSYVKILFRLIIVRGENWKRAMGGLSDRWVQRRVVMIGRLVAKPRDGKKIRLR